LHAHLYVAPIGLKVIYCGVPISVPWADVVELTVLDIGENNLNSAKRRTVMS
jgi:hypothetical protein